MYIVLFNIDLEHGINTSTCVVVEIYASSFFILD